jgi:hypothetical protein
VRRLLQTWRTSSTPPSADPSATHTPREVTGWIIRPAAERTEQEQTDLTRILDRCQTLRTVDRLVGDFAGMLRERRGRHLDAWIADAKASDIPQLQGFAVGLLKDYDAVRNGLTLDWSSGRRRRLPTQGNQQADVRPSQLRPPTPPRLAEHLTVPQRSRTSCQSHHNLAVDT